MIRIYLDWSIISYLKQPEFSRLKAFIEENKHRFLFPYSAAHFSDLMKSYSMNNVYFQTDLKNLEWLSNKHLLHWEDNFVQPKFCTPKDYFESYDRDLDITPMFDINKLFNDLDKGLEESGLISFKSIFSSLKKILATIPSGLDITEDNKKIVNTMFPDLTVNSNHWDLMKQSGNMLLSLITDRLYYKNLRNSISEQGFVLDKNSGNWDVSEVMANVDAFLKESGFNKDFLAFVDYVFELRNEKPDRLVYFTACYNILDLLGYKADKLPKPSDTAMNIYTDAQHSFYAAHCDYFVVADKNLLTKTNVLYHKFNIRTKVISPYEMIDSLESRCSLETDSENILGVILDLVRNCENRFDFSEHQIGDGQAFSGTLPRLHFDFFTDVSVLQDVENKRFTLAFFRRSHNYSEFYFYTEVESLLQRIFTLFKWESDRDFSKMALDLMNKEGESYAKLCDFGVVILDLEENKLSPRLTYIIPYT
ncbi:hypothetical protein [Sphingobacterium gobiense]|uniref:Uncharacterized protein n=1 Tax=Sphingobacterium gobiense TaxID=1382456 RepID=A0A2S9JU23_9SPHI|nr:hypothetical protein [Sphingobacterium gobiense]PRD56776.1 hypothetical protein C5749_05995 [Sphingobacterium gobiense]